MAEEKLDLKKAGFSHHICPNNLAMSRDSESFHYTELNLASKGVEQIVKTIEEAKEVNYCYLAGNNIADPSQLKELSNLIHLDLAKNKVKIINIFLLEETLVNLKYFDLSGNKVPKFGAWKLPKLEYLDFSDKSLKMSMNV